MNLLIRTAAKAQNLSIMDNIIFPYSRAIPDSTLTKPTGSLHGSGSRLCESLLIEIRPWNIIIFLQHYLSSLALVSASILSFIYPLAR